MTDLSAEYAESKKKFLKQIKEASKVEYEPSRSEKERQKFIDELVSLKKEGKPYSMTDLKKKHGLQLLDQDKFGNKVIPDLNPNHRIHTEEEYQAFKDFIEQSEVEEIEEINLDEITNAFINESEAMFHVNPDDIQN